ncbi:alpha-1,2-fucosyltransferase [Parabacteroides johnsonii]|uniref:alpha-1,2-fucosyltransferase n=1 Tax=Parabacteroides johnsonii TaxID=387661 RepID=UPI00265CF89B|nr:alpha-1,2-fucosyltransferase [Parabacteroides johnsonii]
MIVVKLSGGLGNQMFQYTLVKLLRYIGREVEMDISAYQYINDHYGPELLSVFNLDMSPSLEKSFYSYNRRESIIRKYIYYTDKYVFFPCVSLYKMRHLFSFYCRKYHLERKELNSIVSRYDEIQDLDDCILIGWANPDFFAEIQFELKKDFVFTVPDRLQDILFNIRHTNSVSIHVRRGDYLKSQNRNNSIALPKSYYDQACSIIEEREEDIMYYIFSDDENYIKQTYLNSNIVIVNCNTSNYAYYDMYLMSQCKHNIVANSTFSWWAAWLNSNENKIVVSPKYWYDNVLFIPCKNWIVLDF